MAIREEDFLTLGGVASIADRGEKAINMFMTLQSLNTSNLVQRVIDHLEMQITELKKEKNNFLAMFGCSSTEAFKQRVRNYYYYSNLVAFTGADLQAIINDFKAGMDDQSRKRAEQIELMIYNLINSDLQFEGKEEVREAFKQQQVTDQVVEYVTQELIRRLSGKGLGGTLHSTRFGSAKTIGDGKQVFEIAASLTTDAFNKHVVKLQEKANQKLNGALNTKNSKEFQAITTAKILLKPLSSKANITQNGMQQTFGVQWADLISSITGGTGKGSNIDPTKINSGERDRINAAIVDMILERLNLKSDMRALVKNRIYSMLNKDKNMFFVGRSYTQLEGILGEINAILAITDLLGEKYRPKTVKWIGSQPGIYSKKQPSIDIVLREIGGVQYGVQVKNTVDEITDALHYINFADKKLFRDNIQDPAGIFDLFGGSKNIEDVYISDAFNVPYKHKGLTAYRQVEANTRWRIPNDPERGDFQRFLDIEALIDSIVAQMNMYLTYFASDFLYMGLGSDFTSTLATLDNKLIQTGGNFVYIVGSEVFFAEDMLKELQQQLVNLTDIQKLNEETSFKLESHLSNTVGNKKYNNFTIVDYLNGKGSFSNATIKLRSSWGFHT